MYAISTNVSTTNNENAPAESPSSQGRFPVPESALRSHEVSLSAARFEGAQRISKPVAPTGYFLTFGPSANQRHIPGQRPSAQSVPPIREEDPCEGRCQIYP